MKVVLSLKGENIGEPSRMTSRTPHTIDPPVGGTAATTEEGEFRGPHQKRWFQELTPLLYFRY